MPHQVVKNILTKVFGREKRLIRVEKRQKYVIFFSEVDVTIPLHAR